MMKVVLRIVNISVTVLCGVLIVCALYYVGLSSYSFGYRVYTEPAVSSGNGQSMLVQVTEDMSLKDLAEVLEEKGLIRDARLFYLQATLCKFEPKMGNYTLKTSMTPSQMMEAMTPTKEDSSDDS
ncbi:MAG: aminodeoxychorismate lyase [Lachnospiraceae bacterium]|nr:aminodeoxychorismate lyase [Lachnospiraceae bacterium]MDY3817591.1 aminodeoxychorismate lyase [Lachnospiraceae bacterium]